jgi:acid phosphatase
MRTWLIVLMITLVSAISFAQIPASNHVVMVVEGNHGYSSVIGNSTMPYLNSLASKYGLATQYYANMHPAIGNNFEMTMGSVPTNNDTLTPSKFPVSADNIVTQMMLDGKTWKSYAEGLPNAGYTGGNTGNYAVRNNPFAYFAEVQNSDAQKLNLVPFSEFATDMESNQLPDFSFIVPNLQDNGYNGSLQQADGWLKKNIAPLLANPAFQKDGLLIITFEESDSTDKAHGGGHVATIVIGPKVKQGYKSTTLYQHQSLLRTIMTALGTSNFPGAAASAPAMSEFFTAQTAATATPAAASAIRAATTPAAAAASGVTISSPASGATVASPVQFVASAVSSSSTYPITSMRIYVDSTSMYTVSAASINTSLTLATGTRNVTIVAWDKSGKSYTTSESITVAASNSRKSSGSVTITSPASGTTVSSPVQFVASATANSGKTITSMEIYVDSVSEYLVDASSLNTSLTLASGAHSVVIEAWDNGGTAYKSSRSITVAGTAAGTLTVSPGSLSFGSVSVGSSASQTLTVTAGTASVTITAVNPAAGFTVSGQTLPLTVAAGSSASFSVKFTPTTAGTVSGSLSVVSNASNSTATVALNGTGTASSSATPPSVTLNWSANSTVSGYYVFRGTASGGPYTQITSSMVSGTSYTDSTVSAGTTYYYVMTALNSSGVQSAYSSQAQAIVPAS